MSTKNEGKGGTVQALICDWGDDLTEVDVEEQEAALLAVFEAHNRKLTPKCLAALEAA